MSASYIKLEEAFACHQKGELAQAQALCEAILTAEPNNADALHLSGVIEYQSNHPQRAVELIEQAIRNDSNRPAFYSNCGNALLALMQFEQAVEKYNRAIAMKPDFADAYFNLGNALHALKRFEDAAESYRQAIKFNPTCVPAYSNLGNVMQELKRFEDAVLSYDQAIAIKPDFAGAYFNRGNALQELKRFEEAIASYDNSINIKSDYAETYFKRGNALQELKQFEEAIASYDSSINIKSDYADAFVNRGLALHKLKQFENAIESYDRAITIKPDFVDAYYNRGNTLTELERLERAVDSYNRAIALSFDFADAYFNRGGALLKLKHWQEAVESYDRVIAIKPDYVDAYFKRGNALQALNQLEIAIENYDQAIHIKPDFSDAFFNRGLAHSELKQFEAAIDSFDCAIKIKPDFAEAHLSRGNVLRALSQFEAAVACYDHAISIKPDFTDAYVARGHSYLMLNQFEEAVSSYEMAIAIKPDFDYLLGLLLHTKMKLSDWRGFEETVTELIKKIERQEKASYGFPLCSLTHSLSLQRKATEIFAQDKRPYNNSLGVLSKHKQSNKIRVGYFSADFRIHPILFLLMELLECHDKNRFEIIAFSFGPNTQDAMRQRAEKVCNQFIDVRDKTDKDIAAMARQMNIDIAIDLGGDTTHSRSGIFAYRAAPIQVNYLGYPGTLGADYFDYIIADCTIIPVESQSHYAEKIVYLPNSYQPNDSMRVISEKEFTRKELGLPNEGFVFCCFNHNYKIIPMMFDGWMRILKATPGSVLFLYADNKTAEQNLRKEAEVRDVNSNRLIFGKGLPPSEYLARYKVADLFLNTFPYNAGTTASDALWVGLPILTLSGETFVSRVTASLLNAIGLPELITTSQEAYEALAIELATHPTQLKTIKEKLAANRLTTPLFNTTLFTKQLENAYTQMVGRYQADLSPDHIYVQSITN